MSGRLKKPRGGIHRHTARSLTGMPDGRDRAVQQHGKLGSHLHREWISLPEQCTLISTPDFDSSGFRDASLKIAYGF